jgi:uncharacterized protein YdeI (YjbR/CyaY-like superfamily)
MMGKRSAEVDAYIANAAAFAQPILKKIRKAFHDADPEIEETLKWRSPTFMHNGIVGGMVAFKAHVNWGFWKGKAMTEGPKDMTRVTSPDELPRHDVMVRYVREAVRLNDEGVKVPRAPKKAAAALEVPAELEAALKKNKKAKANFDAFSASHQREYAQWIAEAKQDATRKKRIATAIEWLAEGKPRNWKYMK